MSNDMVGDNSSASPAEAVETTDVESVGSRADEPAMSAKEFLTRRSELREKASAKKTVEKSSVDLANQEEEASEDEGSQPQRVEDKQDPNKEVLNNKFQKRIDKLTARYHEAERKASQKDIQIEKLTKGVEILQKELERYASQLQLDPREERIKELEYRKEIDEFNRGLNERQENIYNESVREYQVQQRADEILDEVNSAVEEYDLVSPEEVLLAMRDKGLSATQAARDLHQQRLQRAQKKLGANKHPSTVSRKGSESISPVDEPYKGTETIKKFLLQRMAERDGVAE